MTIQKCVRTYEEDYSGYQNNPCAAVNCDCLNSYLEKGWKVVTVTPKPKYNEYIIEKEMEVKEMIEVMMEVTLAFATQEQADNAVLALSNGYKVEQWYAAVNTTMKPYCVRAYVPSKDVREV